MSEYVPDSWDKQVEKLEARIAELERDSAIEKGKLLNHIRWLNEAKIAMRECADELEKALKESTHFLDIGLDVTEKLIAKLRGQSQ